MPMCRVTTGGRRACTPLDGIAFAFTDSARGAPLGFPPGGPVGRGVVGRDGVSSDAVLRGAVGRAGASNGALLCPGAKTEKVRCRLAGGSSCFAAHAAARLILRDWLLPIDPIASLANGSPRAGKAGGK
mmetsp:Transcript_69439/g.179013  ORF Transcript_69439/g.179013 Transcript_69439/m.179013 type:complete len:129 (+) Transcript_69439:121-507(+)